MNSEISLGWTSADEILRGIDADIVFSDLRMPGKSGIAIYRELLHERPGLARRFVLVTGDMIGARAEVESLAGASAGRRSWKSRSARLTSAACSRPSTIRSASGA